MTGPVLSLSSSTMPGDPVLSIQDTVEGSPRFKNSLAATECKLSEYNLRFSKVVTLLNQREALNKSLLDINNKINAELQSLVSPDSPLKPTISHYTSALSHWSEATERHNEQIRMVLTEPLSEFLANDFRKVELRQQQYHTAVNEHHVCSTFYSETKTEDSLRLQMSSERLFNAHYNLGRLAARYVMNLQTFFTRKDIFIAEVLGGVITTYFAHHQLGNKISDEIEAKHESIETTLSEQRKGLEATGIKLKEDFKTTLNTAERAQTVKLLNLQLYDLQLADEATKTAAKLNEYTNIEEMAPPTPPDEISGYLWVGEKSTFGHSWTRQWCVVNRGMFNYQCPGKAEQRINLKLCQVKGEAYGINRPFSFNLFSPVKPLILQAESSQERDTWVMLIHKAIANAISKQAFSISDNPLPECRKDNSVISLSVLKELQGLAGNMICADCAKKKPTWASLNLGVLICIECSGIHRGLGVHISQVRSLTLDALNPEQVEMLREVGNAAANEVYEAELADDKVLTNHTQRKEFIVQKYANLTFTSSKYHDAVVESRKTGSQKTLAALQTK